MTAAVLLSLKVAALSTLLAMPVGTALAWLLARRRGWWSPAADAFVALPMVLPPLCVGYLLLTLFSTGGVFGGFWRTLGLEIPFTQAAAVIAAFAVSLPLMVRFAQTGLESVDPDLEDAARTMGGGEWEIFWRITLPLSRNGLIAGAVLSFARAVGEFGATILFAGNIEGQTRTMALAMFHFYSVPGGEGELRMLMWISLGISFAAMLIAHQLTPKRRRK